MEKRSFNTWTYINADEVIWAQLINGLGDEINFDLDFDFNKKIIKTKVTLLQIHLNIKALNLNLNLNHLQYTLSSSINAQIFLNIQIYLLQ